MTTIPTPPVIRPRTDLRWLWAIVALMLTPFIALAMVAVGVTSYLRLSSDTGALRDEVINSSGVAWRKQIALNVGGFTLGAARTGLAFARLPEEVRLAFAALRGAEVGVYRLSGGSESPNCAAMLAAAERAMTTRGWERIVR